MLASFNTKNISQLQSRLKLLLARRGKHPKSPATIGIAEILVVQGKAKEAIKLLSEIEEEYANSFQFHLTAGRAYRADANADESRRSFELACKLAPQSDVARKELLKLPVVIRRQTSLAPAPKTLLQKNDAADTGTSPVEMLKTETGKVNAAKKTVPPVFPVAAPAVKANRPDVLSQASDDLFKGIDISPVAEAASAAALPDDLDAEARRMMGLQNQSDPKDAFAAFAAEQLAALPTRPTELTAEQMDDLRISEELVKDLPPIKSIPVEVLSKIKIDRSKLTKALSGLPQKLGTGDENRSGERANEGEGNESLTDKGRPTAAPPVFAAEPAADAPSAPLGKGGYFGKHESMTEAEIEAEAIRQLKAQGIDIPGITDKAAAASPVAAPPQPVDRIPALPPQTTEEGFSDLFADDSDAQTAYTAEPSEATPLLTPEEDTFFTSSSAASEPPADLNPLLAGDAAQAGGKKMMLDKTKLASAMAKFGNLPAMQPSPFSTPASPAQPSLPKPILLPVDQPATPAKPVEEHEPDTETVAEALSAPAVVESPNLAPPQNESGSPKTMRIDKRKLASALSSLNKSAPGKPQESTPLPAASDGGFNLDDALSKLSSFKIAPMEETGDPTPNAEQRLPFSDDDDIKNPTKSLAEIFISQGAHAKAIKVYDALILREPHNADIYRQLIQDLRQML